MDLPYYPINSFGPLMPGLVVGGLGILHVFVAQFAIGGGFSLCYFQWRSQRKAGGESLASAALGSNQSVADRNSEMEGGSYVSQCSADLARRFLDSYFKALVLISFVIGALTGVGMWFTTIQISPRTIGMMVDQFHWIWAIEWTFFCVEIVAGYTFYRYGDRLSDRTRFRLLLIYSLAAWMSLFWINGILSWQLTPGQWIKTHSVWAGFFNPSFWPSLCFRTVVSLTIASLAACIVINTMSNLTREEKSSLIHVASRPLISMVLMPLLGIWFLASIPEDSRSWVLGGSTAMTMFMSLAVGASLLVGLYAVVALILQRVYINGATATLLTALALGATGGGEFVREGVRKPYTIRHTLLSNSLTPNEVVLLRQVGCTTNDPYPIQDDSEYANAQLTKGAQVYRFQCSICHTLSGMNGLTHLTGSWSSEQKRMNISRLQQTKTFMPPFAGTAGELEALVQLLNWEHAGKPREWPLSDDPEVIRRITEWLDKAGPQPSAAATPLRGNHKQLGSFPQMG